ncbi:MAG: tyrosine-type recombinase/integrase [Synergistaceae bacterium]|jgi:integrase/recombinase XerD|nr:integrase [Bacteroidia bacterium]
MYELKAQGQTTELVAQTITEDLYSRYTAYLDASPKTVQSYTRAVRQFARWLSLNGITQPQREDVLAYREWLKEDHKPTTVQSYIIAVRLFFQWTAQAGLYPNIAEHIKGAKLNREHKKDYLTSKQVKAVLSDIDRNTAQGKRNYAVLALMITGGLRTVEISRANIEDLSTAGDSSVLYVQGKGRSERTEYVKLMPEVEDAIREYLKTRGTVGGKDPLFTSMSNNSKGKRITERSVSQIAKDSMVEAGYNSDRLTAHSTRHTAVTLALLGGQSLEEVQQFARHANITTTQIYAHNLDRSMNKCEATIAKAIF